MSETSPQAIFRITDKSVRKRDYLDLSMLPSIKMQLIMNTMSGKIFAACLNE